MDSNEIHRDFCPLQYIPFDFDCHPSSHFFVYTVHFSSTRKPSWKFVRDNCQHGACTKKTEKRFDISHSDDAILESFVKVCLNDS